MIEQIPNSENMTADEILSWLTAPRRERLPTADAMWSYAGIAERFGIVVAETIYQALVAAGLSGLATRFASVGLDAGDPQWEKQVDALAAQVHALAGIAAEIRDLGYDTRPQWQLLGMESEPTLEPIQAEKSRHAAYSEIVNRSNAAVSAAALALDSDATADEIRAAGFAAWENWTEPEAE